MAQKKVGLFRDEDNAMIAGVCAGIADYFDTSPNNVRIVFVLGTLVTAVGFGIVAYAVLWVFLPPMHRPTTS
jgi:phage shock protein PspC (stress-responsive transcriptional regulator)